MDEDGNKGVCINRNGTVHCFQAGISTVTYEQTHLRQVFNGENECIYDCEAGNCAWFCEADSFYCFISDEGTVHCDSRDSDGCTVNPWGGVYCTRS